MSLKFGHKTRINNIPALVQIMAWRRPATSHYLNQWWSVYWRIYAYVYFCHFIKWVSLFFPDIRFINKGIIAYGNRHHMETIKHRLHLIICPLVETVKQVIKHHDIRLQMIVQAVECVSRLYKGTLIESLLYLQTPFTKMISARHEFRCSAAANHIRPGKGLIIKGFPVNSLRIRLVRTFLTERECNWD